MVDYWRDTALGRPRWEPEWRGDIKVIDWSTTQPLKPRLIAAYSAWKWDGTPENRDRYLQHVSEAVEAGWGWRDIGRALKISPTGIAAMWKSWKKERE